MNKILTLLISLDKIRSLLISGNTNSVSGQSTHALQGGKHFCYSKENTFFSSTGGGALGFAAAGSSGGNPSFLLLSA